MKKNYIQPSVDLVMATWSQTLMASDKGANLQPGGNTSQGGIKIGGGSAPARVGKIYI